VINYLPFDLDNPDFDISPLFNRLQRYEVVVEPGEIFYQPYGWWHQVYAIPDPQEGMCVSVSHFYWAFWARPDRREDMRLPKMISNPMYTELCEDMMKRQIKIKAVVSIQKWWRRLREQWACRRATAGMDVRTRVMRAKVEAIVDKLDKDGNGMMDADEVKVLIASLIGAAVEDVPDEHPEVVQLVGKTKAQMVKYIVDALDEDFAKACYLQLCA